MVKKLAHPGQLEMNFFEVPPTPRSEDGALDISQQVRSALAETLGACHSRGIDRHEVAARISRLSNRDVGKNMLDRYTAPSADDWRFPLESLPALVMATGDFQLLELIAEKCGCRVTRGDEALLAEIGALTLQERSVKSRLADLRRAVPDSILDRLIEEAISRTGGRA